MKENAHGPTDRRVLASFLLMFSFLVLPVSGIMLHLGDHGGGALDRHLSMTVHNIAALLFCIAAIFHIVNNRRQIALYARKYRREIGLSLFVAVLVLTMAGLHAVAVR